MAITISDGTTTVELPNDMRWEDEFDWQPVAQNVEHTISGAIVVESAQKIKGRPITLSGAENRSWIPLSAVNQLQTWSMLAGKRLQLTLRGVTRTVAFRHQDTALKADPLYDIANTPLYWPHIVTLRFMEV